MKPTVEERINAYRVILSPCRLDVHPQFHSRPSPFCQQRDNEKNCPRCVVVQLLIQEDFAWMGERWEAR